LLIEKTERWGGNIDVHKQSDPTIFLGPKIFLASRAGVLKKLAIEKNIPFRIIKENKERFIYSEGKLLNVKKLVLPYVLKYLFKAPFLKKINTEQTFEEYFLPRIGKKGVDLLLDPILHGIYAEGPKLLSLDALWPFFKQKKSLKNLFKK